MKLSCIELRMKKKACKIVKQCLEGKTCENLRGYFEINQHSIKTRNQNKLIKLPKVNLEFGKRAFKFIGAKYYNELPINIRNSDSFDILLRDHFS